MIYVEISRDTAFACYLALKAKLGPQNTLVERMRLQGERTDSPRSVGMSKEVFIKIHKALVEGGIYKEACAVFSEILYRKFLGQSLNDGPSPEPTPKEVADKIVKGCYIKERFGLVSQVRRTARDKSWIEIRGTRINLEKERVELSSEEEYQKQRDDIRVD